MPSGEASPRAVLDTNVLVAGLISAQGTPAELLRLWRRGAFVVVVSPRLLGELVRVPTRPKIRDRCRAVTQSYNCLAGTVTALADSLGQVSESDEGNNSATITVASCQ